MAKKHHNTTFAAIPLSMIKTHRLGNQRREDKDLRSESMQASLAQDGQLVAGLVEVSAIDEKGNATEYQRLQGTRRFVNISILADKGIINPKTGKPWETMDVNIIPYGVLTDAERVALIHDASEVSDLDVFDTYLTFTNYFAQGMSIEQMLVRSGTLLERTFSSGSDAPPMAEIKDEKTGELKKVIDYAKWASKKRGVIQFLERVYNAPTVLRLAVEEQFKGGSQWISRQEVVDLVKVYTDTRKDANDGKLLPDIKPESITVDNPGPKFMELWNLKQAAIAEAKASGATRAKSVASLNKAAITAIKDNARSKTVKIFALIILQMRGQETLLPVQDALLKHFESIPEVDALLQQIIDMPSKTAEQIEAEAAEKKDAAAAAKKAAA